MINNARWHPGFSISIHAIRFTTRGPLKQAGARNSAA
jgi:hypothetical protein